MSIIDRMLGRTSGTGPQISATPTSRTPAVENLPVVALSASAPPPRAPGSDLIRVYDQFGRKVEIGRDTWRRDVLLPNLQANRDNPDALYETILGGLNDDFAADVLEAARHLATNDPQPRRGAMLLGAVLLQVQDHAGAREVLERAIATHGRDAYLLANLARAYAALGDEERALQLIWQALELGPNEASTLGWLAARLSSQGDAAVLAAYQRAAQFPGSWRAQLWMARHALEQGDLAEATRLYEMALSRETPPHPDLLMQMSGDLGNRGQIELLVRLTQPRFDVREHGLRVGANLLRAYIDLGLLAEARKLLEQLYALQRPDWRDQLMQWETQLDDAQKRYGEVTAPMEVVLVKLVEPIWARGVLGFEAVLPRKDKSAPRVHFVCGSGEAAEDLGDKLISQPTNDLGRLTRALPMFLCEEVYLRTNARTAFLLPWMKQGGFILSARPWTQAFLPPDHTPGDLVVFLHVDARQPTWLLRVTIENMQRQASPVVFERAFSPATATEDVMALLNDLLPRLTILLALRREGGDPALATPEAVLPGYLTGIEQALAVGLAAKQAGTEFFLHQERSIFDHLFDVSLHAPTLLRPRMLLVNALENQARRRKDIAAEYLDKLALLQERHALAGTGAELVAKAVTSVTSQVRG